MADILTNPKARRDYHIVETFEAGIVLHGTEVKALRAGKGQIADAFARVEKDEVFLHNRAHTMTNTQQGNRQNHLPKAVRKLLLHKSEIRKLFALSAVKGNVLVSAFVLLEGWPRESGARCWQGQGAIRQARRPQATRIRPRPQTRHHAPSEGEVGRSRRQYFHGSTIWGSGIMVCRCFVPALICMKAK